MTRSSEYDPPSGVVHDVVARALGEDLGALGDITSIAVIPTGTTAKGRFATRADGVLAGTAAATETFRQVDPGVALSWAVSDGDAIRAGQVLGTVDGSLRGVLSAERTALNLLRHCSGIATMTARCVAVVAGRSRVLDTRKTTPGLRALEKAAVRAGGGYNHRDSLSDAVLIKDNHLVACDLDTAVSRALARWPGRLVECECETLEQVAQARGAGAHRILLDNMDPTDVKTAIQLLEGSVPVEVSGGITIETIGVFAAAEPDFISVGALTHSAGQLDLALDLD